MIWIGLLILAGMTATFFMIDWHLGAISRQIGALGVLIGSIDSRAAEMQERLERIAKAKPDRE
jgi:hypothetical protein